MKFLDLTLSQPVENVALDEAILETAEMQNGFPEVLRVWEPSNHFVVIGRSSPFQSEVNHEYCTANGIDVVRRSSGGASIVTGPGCLMYALLLDYRRRPELKMLDVAHEFVMTRMSNAISRLGIDVQMQGTCDLTIGDRKISGNALRCKRDWMLYHGTMLCQFDLSMISKCLGTPQRQPDYRHRRKHDEFLAQLPTTTGELKIAIRNEWSAKEELNKWPLELTQKLVVEKYSQRDWNEKIE